MSGYIAKNWTVTTVTFSVRPPADKGFPKSAHTARQSELYGFMMPIRQRLFTRQATRSDGAIACPAVFHRLAFAPPDAAQYDQHALHAAMEIDAAVRHRARVLIVVTNHGRWMSEVRDQQETHGKVVCTHLQFSDHAATARMRHAWCAWSTEDLRAAIERVLANRPALLDVLVTPEAV